LAFNKEKIAQKAQKLMRKGQLQKALELYRKIVNKYPSEMRYWIKIGDIQVKNGNKKGAIGTYLHISDEFIQKGFFKKALAILRQIQSLDKNNQEVYDKLATVYIKTNFIPDALYQLEQLQRIQKDNDEQDKLIATLRKMADIDPSHVVHRVHLAETLSKMNNRREASTEFKKVADYLDKNNKSEDFIKVAERYLFHSPEDKDYIKKLGHAYLETNKPHKIVKRLLKIYQSDPADMDNLHLLARVFIALNNMSKAIKVYKEMARLLKEQDKKGESQAVLKKILKLDPNDIAAQKALGILRKQESNLHSQPAKPEFEEIDPDQVKVINDRDEQEIEEVELSDDDIEVLDEDDLIIIEEDALGEDQKKLVEETEAFIKFGLLDKARENLAEIAEIDHYKVDEVKMKIMLKMGKKNEALEIMQNLLDKYPEDQENKKQGIIQRALEIEPECKWALEAKKSFSTPSTAESDNMSTQQIAAILDFDDSLDDAFSMMDEIESAEQELSFSDYHPDFDDMDNQLHSDEEVDEALSQQEEQLYLDSDNPEEIEEDIEDMLTSLKGLNDELSGNSTSSDSQHNQVIVEEIDELQALKDASQSFIRINELSREQKIEDMDSKFDFSNSKITDKHLELNEEIFEFDNEEEGETPVVQPSENLDNDAKTPVVELDPITHEIKSSSSAIDDEFNLDLDNTEFELDTIDSKSQGDSQSSEEEEEFSDQETMQKFDEMMEFSNKVYDEISVISSTTKLENNEKANQENIQPETFEPEVEEELPEEVADALEEIDFFISIESMEEAKRCFQEITKWHNHSTLQKYFELLNITGPPEIKQDKPEQPQSNQEAPELEEETDKKEKIQTPEEDLDEDTDKNLDNFSEEDIQDIEIDIVPQINKQDNSATEDLSLDFSYEEESKIQQFDLNDNDESTPATAQKDDDSGMRIETEKPIGDASSHLDLGLAYKGMGLYNQALEELKYAMEDDQYETQARILAAKCKQALGQTSEAANTLKYALHNQNIKEEEKLDVYYELGIIYAALEDKDEALYFFKKVARTNSSYRKVQNKIDELSDK
jgi:pilus assembly protein FimV